MRPAAAGAAAALVWAAVEPLDKRILGLDYSDVALLGKAVSRRRWRAAGLAIHAANGAAFGLATAAVARRTRRPFPQVAFALALTEHVVLFPLAAIADRRHPARGEQGLAPIFNARGFAQATWRHAVFGAVLGRLAR
jgi:hypothetical protein